jgi:hypothetical protein
MCSAYRSLIVAVSFLAGCAERPGGEESTTNQPALVGNGLVGNKLAGVKLASAKLAADKLAGNRLGDNRFKINLDGAAKLLSSDDGVEVLSFIVSCALPGDTTLEATVNGTTFDFFGELGLAPEWMTCPLSAEGQGWISACLFARINAHDESLPLSLRASNVALATSADERAGWTVEEGAFYGNLFTPDDQPPRWIACRGSGQLASADASGLIGRDCAKPDPANPGYTLCGFVYAGDCGAFASDPVCEQFSASGTFYRRCHEAPLSSHAKNGGADPIFAQVITSYVTP